MAILGSGLVGSVVTIAYDHYKDKSNKIEDHAKHFTDFLKKKFSGEPDLTKDIAGLPYLPRNTSELELLMDQEGVIALLEGPSGSGKSTMILRLLKGRHGIYISVRKGIPTSFFHTLASTAGTVSKDNPIPEEIIISFLEQGLKKFKASKLPCPIIIIDDIQVIIRGNKEKAGAILGWLVEMANNQLANIILVSSEKIHEELLRSASGYSARLHYIERMKYVSRSVIEKALVDGNFVSSVEEAKCILDFTGPHMADLRKFVIHKTPKDRMLSEAKAVLTATIRAAASANLSGGDDIAIALCENLHKELDKESFAAPLHKVFDAVMQQYPNATKKDLLTVLGHLSASNICVSYWSEKEEMIAFHRPVLAAAWESLRNSEGFKYT